MERGALKEGDGETATKRGDRERVINKEAREQYDERNRS